jgi:trehalose 6-phosphate synthase
VNEPETKTSNKKAPTAGKHDGRLIVVSNRLPFVIHRREDGRREVAAGSGGLITALLPVLRDRGGLWLGWPGTVDSDTEPASVLPESDHIAGFDVESVSLTEEDVEKFYMGFSNEVIWPLFHDLSTFCNFDPEYWRSYLSVNKKFAKAVAQRAKDDDFIWVHDYHLMHVGQELRRLNVGCKTAFFLHIPFPPIDIFLQLPWRQALLRALLDYDLVGFQTRRDRSNFVQCLRRLVKDVSVASKGQVSTVRAGERKMRIGHFPIGIDFNDFVTRAGLPEVDAKAQQLHRMLPNRQLILGIDRLDYTKGILLRLEAYSNALQRYPDLHNKVTLIQVVVPSREHIPKYYDLRTQIEQMVGHINGEFTQPGGWVPIHYVFRALEPLDLLAYYRAAEIGLVTPLKDGMNLVSKEYCSCSLEGDSVLILSEFAGAANQLHPGALIVNPFDIEGVADAIHRACKMVPSERRWRMHRMRRDVQRRDVFWWVDSFLKAATDELFVGSTQKSTRSSPRARTSSASKPATRQPTRGH